MSQVDDTKDPGIQEPRCLADSLKPVDPVAYEYALDAIERLKEFFWAGHVLWDTNGNPITEVDQLTAAINAGLWPRTPYEGEPVLVLSAVNGNGAKPETETAREADLVG